MNPTDLTIEILKGIRDEVRTLRQDTNSGFADTSERLGRLERRQTETEVRLSTELVAVVGAVHEVRDVLRDDRGLRERVDDHERRLVAMEARTS
jgi:hypothetical protein